MTARHFERVIYYEDYLVIDPGKTPLKHRQLLSETEYREARKQYGATVRRQDGRGSRPSKRWRASISPSTAKELRSR
jgi:DNA-directed RNA polymerase beta' subunit